VVVIAQAPDTPARSVGSASEPDRQFVGPQQSERLAYSVEEAANVLGVSRDVIYDQLRTGRLKSLKVGRRRIIGRQHIDDFLAGC
jgi:excisionase family DNA binding protein